jgi:hypothetical protein
MNGTDFNQEAQESLARQDIQILNPGDYGELPDSGLMQTKSPYSTAVQVIKPRDLNLIESRCINEAARAGDSFYYSWSQGGSIVEGNTVGSALMMVRNWGNCAVDVRVQETQTSYIFYAAFIDLETGFNLVRPFKMSKQSPKTKEGKDIYKGERGKDIIFQIGASKATRNVVMNAIPKWLTEKVIATAKKNVVAQVEKMGKPKATEVIVKKAEALKIPFDRIEANYGKSSSWDTDKIVAVMGAIRSVEDGIESMEDVFADKIAQNGEPDFIGKKQVEERAKENKAEAESNGQPVQLNPMWWVKKINEIDNAIHLKNFKNKHKKDYGIFEGTDAQAINEALENKENSFKG